MWYLKDNAYNDVFSTVTRLESNLSSRREEWLTYARMYSNRAYQSLGLNSYFKIDARNLDKRITANLVKSNVDTLQAKVGKNKPRPLS
jgi:hypothetical protein